MLISVSNLQGHDLDTWVSKALGFSIMGKAVCYYDPECGNPIIDFHQNYNPKSSLGSHYRNVYLERCDCEIMKTIDSFKDDEKIYNHYPVCLSPVKDYSSNCCYSMPIIKEHRISLIAQAHSNLWIAVKNNIEMISENELQAAMQVFVASIFGREIEISSI